MKNIIKQMLPVAFIIGLTLIVSAFLYHEVMEREENNCWQTLEDSANSVTREMQITFQNDINTLHLAADMMSQEDADQFNIQELEMFQKNTTFSRIDVIYPDDQILLEDGTKKKLREDLSFDTIAEKGEVMSARMTDTETEKEAVYYFVPIMQNEETVAILSGVLESSVLVEEFHPSIYNGDASYCMIDSRDGNFVMDAWHEELGNAYTTPNRTRLKAYENIDLKSEVKAQKTGVIAFKSRTTGKPLYMYYMPLGLFDWELQLFVSEDVAFARLLYLKQMLIYAGIFEVLLLLIYFFWNLRQVRELTRSKSETVEQLHISNTLLQCVTALSSDKNIDAAIQNLLQIITEYFKADRTYIFMYDPAKDSFINTYEYARPGVSPQMKTMPEIPKQALARGIKAFEDSGMYYIPDIEQEKGHETYEILKGRDINRLLAVPFRQDNHITGFVSVDNPGESYDDATLLSSIPFFISHSLSMKKHQDQLQFMSYWDGLTALYNRNKYIQVLASHRQQMLEKTGAVYLDLNGLKEINDQYGHEAGDALICNAAQIISQIYPGEAYRVGGDEFVILALNMEQHTFEEKLTTLQKQMQQKNISISAGILWEEKCNDLEALLKEADRRMYEDKQQYYQHKKKDSNAMSDQ